MVYHLRFACCEWQEGCSNTETSLSFEKDSISLSEIFAFDLLFILSPVLLYETKMYFALVCSIRSAKKRGALFVQYSLFSALRSIFFATPKTGGLWLNAIFSRKW